MHAHSHAARDQPPPHVVVLLRSALAEGLGVEIGTPALSAAAAALAVCLMVSGHISTDMLVMIDGSACLVEPCACARRTKRSSRSAHTVFVGPRLSLFLIQSRSSGTCSIRGLRDLGLLLDDRFGSAPSPLCS